MKKLLMLAMVLGLLLLNVAVANCESQPTILGIGTCLIIPFVANPTVGSLIPFVGTTMCIIELNKWKDSSNLSQNIFEE